MKIVVVIPAYNESENLVIVITEVLKYVKNVIVVDDHSSDKTSQILKKLKVTVIRNKNNFGYTKTLEIGLRKSFEMGADYAITLDADGQHKPENIQSFLKILRIYKPDFIIGRRDKKNRFMETIAGIYSKLSFGFSDPFCGMKAISRNIFRKYQKLETSYSIGT